jgi:hypothetical protein
MLATHAQLDVREATVLGHQFLGLAGASCGAMMPDRSCYAVRTGSAFPPSSLERYSGLAGHRVI